MKLAARLLLLFCILISELCAFDWTLSSIIVFLLISMLFISSCSCDRSPQFTSSADGNNHDLVIYYTVIDVRAE